MNKKVLTLCAAMLLSGSSLVSVYASDFATTANSLSGKWQKEVSVLQGRSGISLSEGKLTLTENAGFEDQKNFLLINEDDYVFDGQNHTWKGRIVVTGKNVTIKNLNIEYLNAMTADDDGTVIENKSAITVFESSVNIENCTISCSVLEGYEERYMANGITLYPLSATPEYQIKKTTIKNASSINPGDDTWPAAPSFGVQILGNLKDETGNGFTYFQSPTVNTSAKISDFSKCTFDVIYDNCATDFGYIEVTGSVNAGAGVYDVEDYKNVIVTPNYDDAGEVTNKAAIKKAITKAVEGATVKFTGTGHDLMVVLNGEDLAGSSAAVQCTDKVMLIGDASAPEGNTLPTEIVDVTNPISAPIQSASWGQYEYFKQATDALKNGSETLLVLRGAVITTTHENGESSYWLNLYRPSDLEKDEINKFKFKFDVVETVPKTSWEVRLKDGYGKYFVFNNAYVTVDVTVAKDSKGNYLFNGGEYLPVEFGLKAGSQYLTFDWAASDWKVVSNIWEAQAFGASTVGRAFMYAETLLSRYGEYFKLKLEYDKDADGTYETDLTSIFAGELTPVKNVWYSNGNTGYDLADPKAREFMLINEKNQILAVNTNEEMAWSAGSGYANIHAYKLELIDAKTYELDQRAIDHVPYYKTNFTLEYKPSAAGMEGTTEIVAIYVDGREVGCYLDKQEPVLAVTGNVGELKDVKITLNPSAVVDAKTWLTSPVYYTVTVKNANKKAQYYGKVLGLEEDGSIDYVAPENVDQTMPEGQFAIEWNGSSYVFTNRENEAKNFTLRGSDFYEVDMAKNLFAYRDYQYNLMDTLEIAPVKDYTSKDGFKRFTAADLNNNTYTVAMKLLNGDSLNVVENHNDKHRVGLDEDDATEWRIEMSQVKLVDATDDFLRYVPDTVTIEVPIKYYVGGELKETTIDAEKAKTNKKYYVYNADAALKICTYILKNTDNNEYLRGDQYQESKGNQYYVCDKSTESATRIAFKKIGDETLNLVPAYAYGSDWWNIRTVYEDYYVNYAKSLKLSYNKIIGGATTLTGVLKDEPYLYKAPTNDLFVINVAEAPTYKKLAQGDKIIISRLANNDEVIYEAGEFAGIGNRVAYKDIEPTLYVDTAYVNRAGNFAYQYLLGVNISRIDTTYECNIPAHGIHKEDTTYGRFLVNMVDSALANKDVHNNKFKYNDEYKLSFVKGYRTNDTLFFTNEAGKVVSSMKIGDANSNIAKFAFKMVDETDNEFVIETGTGYNEKKVYTTGATEVASREMKPAYLRWVNGNLVVTTDIEKAEHFTMEVSDKDATANETIAAGNVVVAGTNGAVVVKGAEGKNVIVSTILGKVVANEVLTSDNAQIAAPAGIVVVSVDGESFKVVVK